MWPFGMEDAHHGHTTLLATSDQLIAVGQEAGYVVGSPVGSVDKGLLNIDQQQGGLHRVDSGMKELPCCAVAQWKSAPLADTKRTNQDRLEKPPYTPMAAGAGAGLAWAVDDAWCWCAPLTQLKLLQLERALFLGGDRHLCLKT